MDFNDLTHAAHSFSLTHWEDSVEGIYDRRIESRKRERKKKTTKKLIECQSAFETAVIIVCFFKGTF